MAKGKAEPSREGWIRVNVSRKDEDGESYFAAVSDGLEVARLEGDFYIWVPVTTEAQQEAMSGAGTTFTTDDGKVKVSGPEAPAARKYYSDALEPVRGDLRTMGENGTVPSAEFFQGMLDNFQPYGGRKSPEVSKGEMEGRSTAELAVLLASRGVKVVD